MAVQRQYTGTAGRIENAQVAVYLIYAAPCGFALLDRALYLPKASTDDPTGAPPPVCPRTWSFATKAALARKELALPARRSPCL